MLHLDGARPLRWGAHATSALLGIARRLHSQCVVTSASLGTSLFRCVSFTAAACEPWQLGGSGAVRKHVRQDALGGAFSRRGCLHSFRAYAVGIPLNNLLSFSDITRAGPGGGAVAGMPGAGGAAGASQGAEPSSTLRTGQARPGADLVLGWVTPPSRLSPRWDSQAIAGLTSHKCNLVPKDICRLRMQDYQFSVIAFKSGS